MAKDKNKTEIISIRLDPLTRDKLAFISDLEYRPMALQIRKVIEDFVAKYEVDRNLVEGNFGKGWQEGNQDYKDLLLSHNIPF